MMPSSMLSAGLLAMLLLAAPEPARAESLRCHGASASEGDTRLSVLYKCGQPLLADSWCAPVYVAGAMHPLQPGCQSVQIESNDVSLPFVRRVLLGEHVRELSEVCLSLVFRECFLCAWDSTTDRQQQQGDHGSTHRASRSSV